MEKGIKRKQSTTAESTSSGTKAKEASSSTDEEKHEVFISFRGPDTRNTFTSHLNAAFKRLGIRTHIDDNLERGNEISAGLLRAIEDAKLSVIVFSKNFAASRWCLDELVKILECGKTKGQIVVPVFYNIDPSSVRHQTASYADAFVVHEEHFQDSMDRVHIWRTALEEAASYSGRECSIHRMESESVEEIAMAVLQKLNYVYVADLDNMIGKYEQLRMLCEDFIFYKKHSVIVERLEELKYKRALRLLRLPPDL